MTSAVPSNQNDLDIVDILRFWEGRDDVPEDLSPYLSIAADEIAGLREENKYYRKLLDEADPKF
jgi:hypothetical protein